MQTHLLLATKPNYTRGRVGCPRIPADTMLPKAAIVVLKCLLAWSNFISALDTGMKAHFIIILRTRNDRVFQLIISE